MTKAFVSIELPDVPEMTTLFPLMLTGMTDNPEFFRFLVNVARTFDEASPSPTPHRPPPDIGRNPGGGRRLNYDAPTTRPNGAA